ncbi:MAG: hypothetical protein H0U74_19460 [Bradymonadaceae bacterium]|nr:hypothetical protein [Lujinxingiaceae bacterium]
MLPAIPAILWWLFGGVLLGSAFGFVFMSDEDTQAVADWLNDHEFNTFAQAFCILVRLRGGVRKQLGIRVHDYSDELEIVRNETVAYDDLPDDVQKQLARKDRVVIDVTEQLSMSLSA